MDARAIELESAIRLRLAGVQEQVATAAQRADRAPESVRLVVVTKWQSLEVVRAAIAAGALILGENYAEEAVEKIQAVRDEQISSAPLEWHMIGHIQGRKAKLVAAHFDFIHSVDSMRLAERLDRAASEVQRDIPILLELNVGGEIAKHGWHAADEAAWPGLLDEIAAIGRLPHLKIRGLMTMPPLATQPEASRPYFQRLRGLQSFLIGEVPDSDWSELSMGTSTDFQVAVEEGSTMIRVGEAILGPRPEREPT